jgi:Predicted metalloendopeptidase
MFMKRYQICPHIRYTIRSLLTPLNQNTTEGPMRIQTFPLLFLSAVLMTTSLDPLVAADLARHGVDLAGMDKSIAPGDDFFAYANGTWMKTTEIPADRSSWGVFQIVADEANRRTVGLIQDAGKSGAAAGSEARKVGDFYDSYMDEKAIEAKGITPLSPELKAIRAIDSRKALATVLGRGLRADVDPLNNTNFHTDRPFGLWVSPDFHDPDRNVAYLLQGGLGMPDRDNYLSNDARDVSLRAKYRDHIAAVLKLAGISGSEKKADAISALERKIAEVHATATESEDVHNADNPWRMADFSAKAPGLDWKSYFTAAGLSSQPMIMVWQPKAIRGIAALAGSEPLSVWKDYLTFHAIDRAAAVLPKAFVEERFRFYGTALTGAPKLRDRWKRAVDATNASLGEAVGKLYVQHYFPPEAKAAAQEMVKNIVTAFGHRIDRLEWMSPATRAKAHAKLDTLYVGVGYPERWRDYAGLVIKRGDALGNAQRSELFDYRASLAKLGKPVDRSEWSMTPQTVNAVNLPLQNALNFPAAILAPPFFDPKADPVENYGGIGTTIGHEISHSFDDQGSQFDAQGRLVNWWTPEDLAHFQAAAAQLAAEFDAYEPLPGLHVNGKLTLSENLADVAGLAASYDGYRNAYGGKPAPDANGFTGDQRFFVAFGQIWRSKMRPEALRMVVKTNGHAPGEYRADTVRNLDAWYEAFDVKPGQKLYLAPAARVRAW